MGGWLPLVVFERTGRQLAPGMLGALRRELGAMIRAIGILGAAVSILFVVAQHVAARTYEWGVAAREKTDNSEYRDRLCRMKDASFVSVAEGIEKED